MICYIGIGSNLGDRRDHFETAAKTIASDSRVNGKKIRVSPIYETPAMLPPGAPVNWRIPYLNAVIELDWSGTAQELLLFLKSIEIAAGRTPGERWAPRVLDLDILIFGDLDFRHANTETELALEIPHPGLYLRSFVLDPLKDLKPGFVNKARGLSSHAPLWMGILNLTPDSFSGDGLLTHETKQILDQRLDDYEAENVQVLDVGAESTRPGANTLSPEEEWARLEPTLQTLTHRYQRKYFKPVLSVDTHRAATARLAIAAGANWINDVGGLRDPEMIEVLKNSNCNYVLMHSLSVPAGGVHLPNECDPVEEVRLWAETKLEELEAQGILLERIIFDPGIGFGKTTEQSITLLKRIGEFTTLPVRLLVGHSRKAFLKSFVKSGSAEKARDRDPESIGVSLRLTESGCDILRVHNPSAHIRAFHAFRETRR